MRDQYSSVIGSLGMRGAQRGAVLVIGLIMLAIVSILALTSVREAVSTEAAASNVRTTELATQAAEIALKHCELSVAEVIAVANGEPPSYSTTFTASNILPASSVDAWQNTATWDSESTEVFVLPLELVNQTGLRTTFNRAPECMVAPIPLLQPGSALPADDAAFVVTARGFGPEVPAGRVRPKGTEVWLQSHIELE